MLWEEATRSRNSHFDHAVQLPSVAARRVAATRQLEEFGRQGAIVKLAEERNTIRREGSKDSAVIQPGEKLKAPPAAQVPRLHRLPGPTPHLPLIYCLETENST